MTILEIIGLFIITWWLVIFFVLPFGNEYDENPPDGLAKSAPKNGNLKKKAIITTMVSLIITLIVYHILATSY